MKATELRINNYVYIGINNFVMHLNEEDYENLVIFKTWDRLNPIPLTEEWLIKLDFNKFPGSYPLFNKDNFWACELINVGFLKIEHLELTIKYVHQLQNLYFALTGEELT